MSKNPSTSSLLDEELPSLDLSFEWVKGVLYDQKRSVDSLDTKATTLFSVATVIIGIAIGFGLFELHQELTARTLWGSITLVAYIGVVICTILATKVRSYETLDNPETIREWYWDMSPKQFKLEILSHLEDSFKYNDEKLKEKAQAVRCLIPLIGAEVIFLLLTFSVSS